MFDAFKIKAEAVSAEVYRFPTKDAALDFILGFLKREGVADAPQCYALWADSPFLEGLDKGKLSKEVPGLRFDVTRELAAQTRIGISQMDWGLADTGTLVQDSTRAEQRLVSTLPAIHIALIATDRILADLPTVLKKVNPEQSSYIAMITGPSRTSDIERVLTIGVHGPVKLIIAAVDELGG
ncbi:MAG TPA: lactate utilization protein [Syntrophobacteraceae bacterium]|nr:lactate utilization protein [Syntrophobacteraceae bacterium]